MTQLAEEDKRLQGIVAWAPLELGRAVKPVLARYKSNALVKGIRRIIQFEPDPGFCLQNSFIEGVQLLADYEFTFDICVAYHQLDKVIELVKVCPEVTFMLDHMGKPDIKNHQIDTWKSHISELSKMHNVHCKLSGLLTEADHKHWKPQDICDYVNCVIDDFTPDRIIFGGDWPVLNQAGSFLQWISVLDNALTGLSQEALLKIYHTNAEQFYRLS